MWQRTLEAGFGVCPWLVPASLDASGRRCRKSQRSFLANAVDRGTFLQYVAQRPKAVDGMSLVVGQGYAMHYAPDRLYVVLKLPPEPHTFKVVIGWRDHDNRGDG
jgi:hypothetical protein